MTRFAAAQIGGLALAVVSIAALAACSATPAGAVRQPGSIGAIPAAGTPSGTAGSITYGYPEADAPNWILPVPTSASNTVYNDSVFGWQMWRPLYFTPDGSTPRVNPALSLADPPVWSNGDATMSITLKPWKWSNGQPISSKDLLFTIDEIRAGLEESAANWAAYVPAGFPDTITSMSRPDSSTLVINMKKAVNPAWMEQDIIDVPIMPAAAWARDSAHGPIVDFTNPANAKRIFDFLTAASKSTSTYATNPLWQVVDGPYKLRSFNPATGAFTMVPNTAYSGPHASPESGFAGVPFTSDAAQFNALESGSVDVAALPAEDTSQLRSLERAGYDYYGLPAFGDYFVAYNFRDKTGDFGNIVGQLYFRQAMQHLEDQAGQIEDYLDGAGDPAYGPVPAYPKSPFLPADATTNPYPFSVPAAMSLLRANGWNVVASGTDTCARPGTAPGECGAGIPAGTKLAFNLIYAAAPPIFQEDQDLAANAKAAGIEITLSPSSFSFMTQNYNDTVAPANENEWAAEDYGGQVNATYPTRFGFLNTGGGQVGNYSNPAADALIDASVSGANPAAVTAEASFFTTQLPVLWQPVRDQIYAWKTDISAAEPAAFENLTQGGVTPEFWYLTK